MSSHQRRPVHHLSSCPALLRVPVRHSERQWVRLEVRPGRRRDEGRCTRCCCPGLLSCCLETLWATWELAAPPVLSDHLTNRAAVTSSVCVCVCVRSYDVKVLVCLYAGPRLTC